MFRGLVRSGVSGQPSVGGVYGSVQVRLVGRGCDADADHGDHREQLVFLPSILSSTENCR